MRALALTMMGLGLLLLLGGGLLYLAARFNLPLGRLPGDFNWQGKGWSVHFPLATMIILSILLTLLLNLFFRR